jgi:hypothetical protein
MTTAPRTRSRGVRRLRRAGVVALGGLVVWALAGLPFLVLPRIDPVPRHADVVLMLGPPVPERVATAERLLADGRVDHALISIPYSSIPSDLTALCERSDVTCFAPDPSTTRGEAEELGRQAAEHGWTSAVVVTMTPHLTRARMLVGRCFGGRVAMVSSGEQPKYGWAYQYAYQTAATVKAWILAGC